jgi:hypothetical protein
MGEKSYILTTDIPEMMEAYEDRGIQITPLEFFEGMQVRLIKKLEECVSKGKITVIPVHQLIKELAKIISSLKNSRRETVVVSPIHNIVTHFPDSFCIQVNRIINVYGNFLKTGLEIGPRPGYGLLNDQVGELKEYLKGRPVILVDDGSFTGTTMRILIDSIEEEGIEIDHVVVGFMFPNAKSYIMQRIENGKKIHCWQEGNYLDWLPDHDFFPFIPNCGRVLGWDYNEQAYPGYLSNGLSLCKPYILPYCEKGKVNEWANIDKEKENEFSKFCITEAITMFEEMEKINKRKLSLNDLLDTYPRVNVPIRRKDIIARPGLPQAADRIIDLLHSDLQEILH